MEEDKFDEEVLSTKIRQKSKSAIKGSDKFKSFRTQVEREILFIGWDTDIL